MDNDSKEVYKKAKEKAIKMNNPIILQNLEAMEQKDKEIEGEIQEYKHQACHKAKIQPKTDNFDDYIKTAVENTRITKKEQGFAYRVRPFKFQTESNQGSFIRTPITPLIEGTECHIGIPHNRFFDDYEPEEGIFHTHPLTNPDNADWQCEFSNGDLQDGKDSEENMVACVSLKAKKGAIVYVINGLDITDENDRTKMKSREEIHKKIRFDKTLMKKLLED